MSVILLIGMARTIEYMVMSIGQDSKRTYPHWGYVLFYRQRGHSILENCAQIGLPISPVLYNTLEKLYKDPPG
jgi:phage-related holin